MTTPTIYSQKLDKTLPLGLKPNAGRPRIRLTNDIVPQLATYTPPASVDYLSKLPASSIGMDLNDKLGDCVEASADHDIKARQVAAGNPEVVSTNAEIEQFYEQAGGYNPNNPASDQGTEIQTAEELRVKNGVVLGGVNYKNLAFASLSFTDLNLVKYAIDQFGGVNIGINFPNFAMQQFDNGQPWDVSNTNTAIEGGHCIWVGAFDTTGVTVVTWGALQKMTWAFWNKYVEEAWINVTAEFVNKVSGNDPLAGTLYALGQQFATLTGQTNPVPVPVTPPVVTPPVVTPPVTPPVVNVDAVDKTFYTAIRSWASGHKTLPQNAAAANQIETWIKGKGLAV